MQGYRGWRCKKRIDLQAGDIILRVDTFRKLVEFLPRAYPNKMAHSGPPSSEVPLVPGGWTETARSLSVAGNPSFSM